mmetsp:Transcript_28612/g.32706  ORF Transcript_28612/g.32706 Transcript_28612/m.32706 type:complete len:121 (+) Transcript_28612:274-636(+)
MDSSRKRSEVLQYYKDKGVDIEEDKDDQDTTDFQKSIKSVKNILADHLVKSEESKSEEDNYDKIIVLFPFEGRIDHTLSNIHTLCKNSEVLKVEGKVVDFILMDSSSTMQCLLPGTNYIK